MGENSFPLIFLAVIAVAFWLLVIRPAKARSRAQRSVIDSAEPGSRVLLASGIIGTISARGDEEFRVEVAPGVVITVVDQAVVRILDSSAEGAAAAAVEQGTSAADGSSMQKEGGAS